MKRAITFRVLAAIAMASATFLASAQTYSTTGHVLRIGTGLPGTEGLYLTLDQITSPACPSGMLYVASGSTQYMETFAIALFAQSKAKAITAYYSGPCDSFGRMPLQAISIAP